MVTKRESYDRDYAKHKASYITRAQKHYARSRVSGEARIKRMLIEARSRSKKKGWECSVTLEDIIWNDICPILGIGIDLSPGAGPGGVAESPSLDRIDNTKGYVKGNVRVISWRANRIKRDMSYEECEALYQNWYETVAKQEEKDNEP